VEADLGVLGVRDEPVDRGEMLPLCQLLVQPPKHLQRHRDTLKQCVATGNMTWTIHKDTLSKAVCGNWKYGLDNTQRHNLGQSVATGNMNWTRHKDTLSSSVWQLETRIGQYTKAHSQAVCGINQQRPSMCKS